MNQIASKAEIEAEVAAMQERLDSECSEDPAEVQAKGMLLLSDLSRSAKLLADAKIHKDRALKESILSRLDVKIPASTLNKLIDADCESENYLVNWLDRLNRAIVHHLDFYRSLISKAKEEMRMGNFQV